MYILNYACTTAAGDDVPSLMNALYAGRDCSQEFSSTGRVCFLGQAAKKTRSYREIFRTSFQGLWATLQKDLSPEVKAELSVKRVGLIFSSTKGLIEDSIWQADAQSIRQAPDPFIKVCEDFTADGPDVPWKVICNVSNACSSSHVALEYVQDLFAQQRLDYALVIAGDLIGPFIFKGFTSLKVVSPTTNRPFSGDRDGLQLGEAASMILLSSQKKTPGDLHLIDVRSDTEGSSITRPSMNGDGLVRAMEKIHLSQKIRPDVVIAHGTGTKFNDLAEERALERFLGVLEIPQTPITNTKWCIGHTLGASGSVDLIAACEVLKRQRLFHIHNTAKKDPQFKMNYLTAETAGPLAAETPSRGLEQVLVSSLGFGGVHAALVVSRREESGGTAH